MTEDDFAALYDALRRHVYAFAARRVGPEAAKDVLSETFEVAWTKRDQFPSERGEWPAWIVGIARNKVLQEAQRAVRKHHDNRFAEDWTDPSAHHAADDVAATVIDSDLSQRVYARLTPAEKLLFEVAFFRDLGPADAAVVLGISTSAFTTRLSRLRQRLRDLHQAEHHPSTEPMPLPGDFR